VEKSWSASGHVGYAVTEARYRDAAREHGMPDEQTPTELESEEMTEAGAPERRADRKRGPAWVMWVILALILLLVLWLLWSYLRDRSGDGTAVRTRSVIQGPSATAPPGEESSGEVPEVTSPRCPISSGS
jgi:hypothetical protein